MGAQFSRLNAWPDGSVEWALASFTLAPRATGPFELRLGDVAPGAAAQPANPVTTADDFSMSNGLVSARCPGGPADGPVTILLRENRKVCAGPVPYLRALGKQFKATWSGRQWITRSGQEAEMEATRDLVAEGGERYGTCRLRVTMFAGCPYVRLLYSIVNQRPEKTFSAEAYGLKLPIDQGRQHAAGPGWVSLQTPSGGLTAVVRWFAHLWPNGIETTPEAIDFQCFRPGDPRLPAYQTHPGEAKTQEIWLAVTPDAPGAGDCKRLAALVETPPRLDTSASIRESQVWGELPPITAADHKEVHAKIEESLTPYFANCKQNIRLFGEYTTWDNFYWNTLHTMYCLYAMTGDRKWLDWAERSVRDHFDVDICHWQPLRTGDDRAAVLLARLANAVYEESHDPWHSKTLPNIDYYYSPNPYLRGPDGFTPITQLNLNIAASQNWQILALLGILLPQFQQRIFVLLSIRRQHPKSTLERLLGPEHRGP